MPLELRQGHRAITITNTTNQTTRLARSFYPTIHIYTNTIQPTTTPFLLHTKTTNKKTTNFQFNNIYSQQTQL